MSEETYTVYLAKNVPSFGSIYFFKHNDVFIPKQEYGAKLINMNSVLRAAGDGPRERKNKLENLRKKFKNSVQVKSGKKVLRGTWYPEGTVKFFAEKYRFEDSLFNLITYVPSQEPPVWHWSYSQKPVASDQDSLLYDDPLEDPNDIEFEREPSVECVDNRWLDGDDNRLVGTKRSRSPDVDPFEHKLKIMKTISQMETHVKLPTAQKSLSDYKDALLNDFTVEELTEEIPAAENTERLKKKAKRLQQLARAAGLKE